MWGGMWFEATLSTKCLSGYLKQINDVSSVFQMIVSVYCLFGSHDRNHSHSQDKWWFFSAITFWSSAGHPSKRGSKPKHITSSAWYEQSQSVNKIQFKNTEGQSRSLRRSVIHWLFATSTPPSSLDMTHVTSRFRHRTRFVKYLFNKTTNKKKTRKRRNKKKFQAYTQREIASRKTEAIYWRKYLIMFTITAQSRSNRMPSIL